ncbi:MAG: tRNA 2-selenouridine(34) synthase MnmH [Eubacteriales bacterium]|uniref:tRNA 2-selenouridine(34) synthase MnmH n=1 Tax=Fenollaria sp. TaxID=1965292 RepID=UPI002A7662D5|nr:tRNA 2-selenouridine(34) synthase MnmH [Fenollaria sp.]MDD7339660.1 tRNA 2-selenouridine(34) synthase MnmH [Eubacteriales bacterium]MDY3106446.1 tRNA 2-selenouridine(34) synthase MnmH [Fenollaria sp.]
MLEELNYEDIENLDNIVLVDVRSEGEYKNAHIPGAISIPILNDDERREVGTLYDRVSYDLAKIKAVEYASKKLPELYEKYLELEKTCDEIVIYCDRGGYRSTVLERTFRALGMHISKLSGGYKSYRRYVMEKLDEYFERIKVLTLYGLTGTHKTYIIRRLEEDGIKVLDLEKYANHRGSIFGSVGLKEKVSQKMFDSYIYEAIKDNPDATYITEGESRRIGDIVLHEKLYKKMLKSDKILIEASLDERAKNICEDYLPSENKEEIIKTFEEFKKFISKERYEKYTAMLIEGEYMDLIKDMMKSYYDPKYSFKKYDYNKVFTDASYDDIKEFVKKYLTD